MSLVLWGVPSGSYILSVMWCTIRVATLTFLDVPCPQTQASIAQMERSDLSMAIRHVRVGWRYVMITTLGQFVRLVLARLKPVLSADSWVIMGQVSTMFTLNAIASSPPLQCR